MLNPRLFEKSGLGGVRDTILKAAEDVKAPAVRAPREKSGRVVDSVVELIGNTPLLRMDPKKTGLKNIDLYAKLEHLNPFGSVKDRTAHGMLEPHIEGISARGQSILELSSGNAARALQAIASIHGVTLETVNSRIRIDAIRKILRVQGAKLTAIDHLVDPSDAYSALNIVDAKAEENRDNCFYTDQYRNAANPGTHYATTGAEIAEDMGKVDYFIGSIGTAGSTVGIATRLQEDNPELDIIGVVSDKSDYIPGIRYKEEIFNIGAFREEFYKSIIGITSRDAIDGVISLVRDYGVMAGPSSGATYQAALRYLRAIDNPEGPRRQAVFIVCDRLELYLSYIEERRPGLFA